MTLFAIERPLTTPPEELAEINLILASKSAKQQLAMEADLVLLEVRREYPDAVDGEELAEIVKGPYIPGELQRLACLNRAGDEASEGGGLDD